MSGLAVILFNAAICVGNPPREPAYLPPGVAQTGGIQHLCMIYHGGKRRVAWSAEALLPYVAYIDENRRPLDWLFDSFLFTEFATDQGASLIHEGEDVGSIRPTAADWKWLSECWFRPATGVAGLEEAVARAGESLGQPDHVANVVIAVPNPRRSLRSFGPLPGQERKLDFAMEDDRQHALIWYLKEVLDRWQKGHYRHLRLLGFYWTAETTPPTDNAVILAASRWLHEKQLKLYWAPYLGSEGFAGWRERGLDAVMLQPGHFFPSKPDRARLWSAARQAKKFGFGIEMEFDARALSSEDHRRRFFDYLDAGVEYGWMTGATIQWYEGGDGIKAIVENPAQGRELYTAVYQFVRGKYVSTGQAQLPKVVSVCRDARENLALASRGVKISGCVRPKQYPAMAPEKIIDGQADFYTGMSEFGYCEIPGSFTLELPSSATIARTQMLLWDLDGRWFQYKIETSADRCRWEPAVDKSQGEWLSWQTDRFPPREARYVRVTPLYNSAKQAQFQVVEFEVYAR
jgi:hypothetical protein